MLAFHMAVAWTRRLMALFLLARASAGRGNAAADGQASTFPGEPGPSSGLFIPETTAAFLLARAAEFAPAAPEAWGLAWWSFQHADAARPIPCIPCAPWLNGIVHKRNGELGSR
jgi:hypothetical protein